MNRMTNNHLVILSLPEQVGALQEVLNLEKELPRQYRYWLIPEILPIVRVPWADEDEVTPTPDDVITWMEGTVLLYLLENKFISNNRCTSKSTYNIMDFKPCIY